MRLWILAAALVVRAALALTDTGSFCPDEVFQVLEPAHRAVFGFGVQAWEMVHGLRSWLLPGVIAGLWKALAAVGLDGGVALAGSARLLVVILSVCGTSAAMTLAGRRGGRAAEALAGVLCTVHPLLLVTSYRTMGESVSGSVLLCALALAGTGQARKLAAAGLLAGLATFVRLQTGLVVLVVCVQLTATRRWRDLGWLVAGGAAAAIAGGLLDWVTWGAPFASLLRNLEFNWVEGGAALYGVSPWWYYPARLVLVTGVAGAALALTGFVLGARRTPWLVTMVVVFIAAHSGSPHKELRFLVPVLPLAMVTVAVGVAALPRRWMVIAASVLTAGVLVLKALTFTWADAGVKWGVRQDARVLWDERGLNATLAWVGRQPDACGLLVAPRPLTMTGGNTWLRRDLPLLTPRHRDSANYLVADQPLDGYAATARPRVWRRPGGCAPAEWPPAVIGTRPR